MRKEFLSVPWLLAMALMAASTTGTAEAPPRNTVPVQITPQMIQQASAPAQPTKDSPYLLRPEDPPHDIFHDTPRNLEHIPNGCSRNGESLCFDYRSGHAVYKPTRKLLPEIPGMTPHNLSIRRNKIVAQYTFK